MNAWVWCAPPSTMPTCRNYAQLSEYLSILRGQHTDRVRLSSLAESLEGRSVWMAEIGRGDNDARRTRPAMLVVAGMEGDQPAGTEASLAFLETICDTTEDPQALVNRVTIYVIPRLNPDAAERFFLSPTMETKGAMTPVDSDRDGLIDEDGPDDLNNDGSITWIRVEDAKGKLIRHPMDGRILIEADTAKDEQGEWLLFREGFDNDKDEKVNEDGTGEVNLNKNFPFEYPMFEEDAGVYQLCEKETRALAEFVVDHPNIGLIVTFSGNGTLLKTPESGDVSEGGKPQRKIRKEDEKYLAFFGEQYRKQAGITKEIELPGIKGSFADWMYFHRGRLSLSTPVWNPEIALAIKSSTEEIKEGAASETAVNKDVVKSATGIPDVTREIEQKSEEQTTEKKNEDKRGQTEQDYLKWLDKNAPEFYLPWTAINHPDYPGQKAEIGGLLPFAQSLPPARMFEDVMKKHASYLTWLAGKLPRVEIDDIEIKNLGNEIFDITAKIKNTGYLPTVLAHGERTGEVFPTRVEINVTQDNILAGIAKSRIGPLEGNGGRAEVRWVLRAKNGEKITILVISALGGSVEREIELKEKGE